MSQSIDFTPSNARDAMAAKFSSMSLTESQPVKKPRPKIAKRHTNHSVSSHDSSVMKFRGKKSARVKIKNRNTDLNQVVSFAQMAAKAKHKKQSLPNSPNSSFGNLNSPTAAQMK